MRFKDVGFSPPPAYFCCGAEPYESKLDRCLQALILRTGIAAVPRKERKICASLSKRGLKRNIARVRLKREHSTKENREGNRYDSHTIGAMLKRTIS